jgi:hypothetical protein
MAPTITRPNTTGLSPLGLYEEYRVSGENYGSSNSGTSHNIDECNSDQLYVCEHVERDRISLRRVSSN